MNEKNLMNERLWDITFSNGKNAIEAGGWKNSFNREYFSFEEMEEYAQNVKIKLENFCHSNTKVLEIGISSGLTMYKLAPLVKCYIGTDFSSSCISWHENKLKDKKTNITLHKLRADHIDDIEEVFDIIILNSVIQCFPSIKYLTDVLNKCRSLLNYKGIIFVGDIMDEELKPFLIKSINNYKEENPTAHSKTSFDNEIFLKKSDIISFAKNNNIEIVDISNKIGLHKNELVLYRYDVILQNNHILNL